MSLALTAAVAIATPLIGLFSGPTRSIGPIIPGIVIEEDHTDQLTITEHPIERGANISDHAFQMPPLVTIQCQWSNTQAALDDFSESYIKTIYQQLIALQLSRVPLTIVTGKRSYPNMLIETITTETDKTSAYTLPVTLSCKTVFLVSTSTTTLPPADQHIDPQQTAPLINGGQSALQGTGSGSQSILLSAGQTAGLPVVGTTGP